MTATLEWKGIPTYIIGIGRGISAGVGLAATVLYLSCNPVSHLSEPDSGPFGLRFRKTVIIYQTKVKHYIKKRCEVV